MNPTTKRCNACLLEKPRQEFPQHHLMRDGLGGKCKECQNAVARAWYKANIDRVKSLREKKKEDPEFTLRLRWKEREAYNDHQRFSRKAKEYGISIADARRLLQGVCAICGATPDTEHIGMAQRALHIDHDHVTGTVRGALCHSCNAGLGRFKDNPELLRQAAVYLEKHNTAQAKGS